MGSNTTNTTQQSGGPFSSNQTQSQNQVTSGQVIRDPYGPTLPLLNQFGSQALGNASDPLYWAKYSSNLGNMAAPYQDAIQQAANTSGVTGDMYTPLAQLSDISQGGSRINTGDLYQQIFGQAQPLASNTSGALTDTQQQILDDNAARLAARQASLYSGAGRYGSEGMGIGMARGIAETNNPLMAAYNQANIQNALAAMGVQQGAATGLSNVQQQNIGNRMNASNAQLGALDAARGRSLQWAGLAPSLFELAMQPAMLSERQQQADAGILSAMAPYLANAGTVTNNANANNSSTGSSSGFQSNITNGQTSTPTPWTTYAGLGLAGIGLLSDVRAKTDIEHVGTAPTGLNMYKFRYKGQPKSTPKFVGPMAQEVQQKDPEAVGKINGLLYIKGQR